MLCLATAIHNFKWLKIICLIGDQTFPRLDLSMFKHVKNVNVRHSFPIKVIYSANKTD